MNDLWFIQKAESSKCVYKKSHRKETKEEKNVDENMYVVQEDYVNKCTIQPSR